MSLRSTYKKLHSYIKFGMPFKFVRAKFILYYIFSTMGAKSKKMPKSTHCTLFNAKT